MEIKLNLVKFTLFYIAYALILGGVASMLPSFFPGQTVLVPKFWLVFGFLGGITFIAYVVVYLGMKRNPETAIMAIMGSIALKMLFSMAFVLIYSLKSKGNGLVFVLNFFSLYLLFSFFEIYCLLCNLRHQNK
ncbi:hypothetical protein [Pedobacter nutrimenti]|uniref:hypothetical protein n=1 Tax=Pedobacter nutrimenti TaxID=1241337 RepID=UPI0010CF37C4|nr:hypothetical protein [Pedobacter nutrimenti]